MEHHYTIHVAARGPEAVCDRQVQAAVDLLNEPSRGYAGSAVALSGSRTRRALALLAAGLRKPLATEAQRTRYDGS